MLLGPEARPAVVYRGPRLEVLRLDPALSGARGIVSQMLSCIVKMLDGLDLYNLARAYGSNGYVIEQ